MFEPAVKQAAHIISNLKFNLPSIIAITDGLLTLILLTWRI